MRILLLGYGKMGRAIESIAQDRGYTIAAHIDKEDLATWDTLDRASVDVAIEFSQPDAAVNNIRRCLERGIPVVSGTTGWLQEKPALEEYCREQGGTFFYASNFSIGVNIFFLLNEQLAKMMQAYPAYEPTLEEIHHTEKKDAPSGTAITLAEGILSALSRKAGWALAETNTGADGSITENLLLITAKREGQIPGTHLVRYQSALDTIEIKHTAHSRAGFAQGAVAVAEWIIHQRGVLTMRDFLEL